MTESQIREAGTSFGKEVRKDLQSKASNPGLLVTCVLLHTYPSQMNKIANLKEVNKLYVDILVSMSAKHGNGDIEKAKADMSKIVRTLNDMFKTFLNFGHEVIVTTVMKQLSINRETYVWSLNQQLKTIDKVAQSCRPKEVTYTLIKAIASIIKSTGSKDLARCTIKYMGDHVKRRAEAIGGCSSSKTAHILASLLNLMKVETLNNFEESVNFIFGK